MARFTLGSEERVLRLRRGLEVVVTVLDDQGRPFPGAEVQARRLEGDPGHEHGQLMAMGHSARDGTARLVGLDPDLPYRLGVYPKADRRQDLDDVLFHDWRPSAKTVTLPTRTPGPR